MKRLLTRFLVFSLCVLPTMAQNGRAGEAFPPETTMRQIPMEYLPSLNIPRASHATLCLGDELVVFGGHTSGFVITPTAEYYKDGEWHVMNMVYAHDNGMAVSLKSGKVLLAGGHLQDLGIEQTYVAEMYDPSTHRFEGFGCLDTKRAMFAGVELDSGRVVIAGNWYHEDAIELFDGKKSFTFARPASRERSCPYVFRTAKDDAVVVGSLDTRGQSFKYNMADRLQGEPYHVPLFDEWQPIGDNLLSMGSSGYFIGDEDLGDYSYLFPVANDSSRVAIARVTNGEFSLLPTAGEVPVSCQFGTIAYNVPVIVDRKACRAYLIGKVARRYLIVAADYSQEPAPLTFFYTDTLSQAEFVATAPVVTSEGDVVVAGGVNDSNFYPSAAVVRLLLGNHPVAAAEGHGNWLWWLLALAVVAAVVAFLTFRRRQPSAPVVEEPAGEAEPEPAEPQTAPSDDTQTDMMPRICQLMDEDKLFLNSELKVADLAGRLGVSSRYISDCIKTRQGCSFSQFINTYRVEHAKHLLRSEPDIKIAAVFMQSGFANETSFFRTFKAFTGKTPREWLAQEEA